MGVRHVLGTGNYLGLPSMIGRKKKDVFALIKDRIWKRINSWRGRALSRAGKEVMIKSVLQAIPTYVMSVYLLPDSTVKDIERMLNSFWWGGGANNKGIRWLAWDRMTYPKTQGGLGFRDIHMFNLAMIAKQGWNIMTKPHTLVSRLYKARYFPNSSLFESKIGHNPSYAWRGIWKAREILMNGCRWSIGSGTSIKIMSEPWLRGQGSVWLPSPQIQGKVDVGSQQKDWSSLWSILAPPKAKHLLWRIVKGCLPTRMRLQERRVPCSLLCPLCNQHNEDDWHVFFGCATSHQARQAAGLEQIITPRLQQFCSVADMIFSICLTENKETAGTFAMLVWILWNNRNNCVWNDNNEPGTSLGVKTRHLWNEWFSVAQVQQNRSQIAQQQQDTRWQKPVQGWYKCNVDAAFHKERNRSSFGWCLRDDEGRFVMAETTWLNGNCSIIEGESIALLEALKVLEQRGISHVIFETDSKSVVDAIHNLRSGSSEFSSIICLIKNTLLCNPNFKVKFIKRQANMVAHTLARAAISWSSRCTFESIPTCILPLLNNEMR
ncbi:unnamed protein product [Trifolium pratense]|uniref:Uncharacterized protein n=1 Tax=Trifolium pratense TaxID=57577 RepID=A0ACB0IRS8_TRIPR|nr:unnamed protein product [Trifolium pratense]